MSRLITFESTPCARALLDVASNLDKFKYVRPHRSWFEDMSHPICVHINGEHAAFIWLFGTDIDDTLSLSLCAPRLHTFKWSTIEFIMNHIRSHIGKNIVISTTNPTIEKLAKKLNIDII